MEWWTRVFLILFAAIAYPYLADRAPAIKILINNTSSKLPQQTVWPQYQILWRHLVRNCEDSLMNDEAGIAYFSCDPGRDRWNPVLGILQDPKWKTGAIWYYEYAKHTFEDPGDPQKLAIKGYPAEKELDFHPLGISLDRANKLLYVVNLAPTHVIEVFQLSNDGTAATYSKTIRHPLIIAPNQIAPLSKDEILFTNDHKYTQADNSLLSHLESYLALPLGTVVHLNLKTNQAKVLTHVPFANGIVLLNSTHLAVASASLPGVFIYTMDPTTKELVLVQKLRPKFFADNLKLDANGRLLIAGHPHIAYVDKIAKTGAQYNIDDDPNVTDLLPERDRPRATSWIAEWDGNPEGVLRDLYIGHDFGSACSASRDVKRGVGMASALYDKGILVWKE